MEKFIQLIIVATIVEAGWEAGKMIWQEDKFSVNSLGAIILGLVVAYTVQLDILHIAGLLDTAGYVGMALTGLLVSRGANVVHELIGTLKGFKEKVEPYPNIVYIDEEDDIEII